VIGNRFERHVTTPYRRLEAKVFDWLDAKAFAWLGVKFGTVLYFGAVIVVATLSCLVGLGVLSIR
jgi:hypothetical protein